MFNTSQPEVVFLLESVRAAARIAHQVQADMAVVGITKEDMSPVTVADYASQAYVGQALRKAFPKDVLVGEESSDDLKLPENAALLDPIRPRAAGRDRLLPRRPSTRPAGPGPRLPCRRLPSRCG